MAILTILHYPDPRLREAGKPVDAITDEVKKFVGDMAETMYAAPGVGLAATQVGVALRIFVIDIADEGEPSDLKVFINPEIVEKRGKIEWKEGCLSFPGATESIDRASWVKVRATGLDGQTFELEAEELLAVAVQHENDHLDGKLMIDRLGPLRKRVLHRKMLTNAD
jgi:peptide deformylase